MNFKLKSICMHLYGTRMHTSLFSSRSDSAREDVPPAAAAGGAGGR